ncbi:LysE family transporter [Rhodoferax saidenbachensis]|uniref:Threonine/homoserine/homoserine lactone efflux protein n=1 Tax=Rhodoferax saidenbachensis TaxID=1484693 RepID=A0ABU1ZSP2_9BURK|nr:LysE family transporter [Rhodoferax saidenbachensis]MDR7308574.1 threonine/homoserine/homoserine lactone efflux protein [Rhodoferax saidenbachensis]
MTGTLLTAHLGLAWATYLVNAGSPGPSNMAIMGMAMNAGRRPALWLAAGVVSGSWFWGVLAALGISQLLAAYSTGLIAMKVVGGLYLLWLAFKSGRAASQPHAPDNTATAAANASARTLYLRGAAMHLTNPKAILSWLAIVTLALPPGAPHSVALAVVAGCMVLGVLIFFGYALAFSTPTARRVYTTARRWLEGLLAAVFGFAGLRLLQSATHH